MGKKSNTVTAVVITILVMLVIGLVVYIVIDKSSTKDEKTKGNETTTTTTTQNETQPSTTEPQNTMPTDDEVREIIKAWMLKQATVVDAKVGELSFKDNNDEFKDMIHADHNEILVHAEMRVIRDGDGYSRSQGWQAFNHELCHLIKNASEKYEVKTCASGW